MKRGTDQIRVAETLVVGLLIAAVSWATMRLSGYDVLKDRSDRQERQIEHLAELVAECKH